MLPLNLFIWLNLVKEWLQNIGYKSLIDLRDRANKENNKLWCKLIHYSISLLSMLKILNLHCIEIIMEVWQRPKRTDLRAQNKISLFWQQVQEVVIKRAPHKRFHTIYMLLAKTKFSWGFTIEPIDLMTKEPLQQRTSKQEPKASLKVHQVHLLFNILMSNSLPMHCTSQVSTLQSFQISKFLKSISVE